MNALAGASIFHHRSHVEFQRHAAMQSSLALDEAQRGDFVSPDRRLSANDFFTCQLARPGVATMVGCRRGGAEVTATDDVLGIPMALHFAGTAATVGALRRIDDEDGAKWAEVFCGEVRKQAVEVARDGRLGGCDAEGSKSVSARRREQGEGTVSLGRVCAEWVVVVSAELGAKYGRDCR
jgi:CHAT domain